MWKVYLLMFSITAIISIVWANLIEKHAKFKRENPDYNDEEGWLDWDKKEENSKK